MNRRVIIATIILSAIIASFTACEGMIGLFEKKIAGESVLVMDHYIFVIENGCEFTVEVIEYYEPMAECENSIIEDVFYKELIVEKMCGGWSDPVILDDGYTGPVPKALHSAYLNLLCGK